MEFKKVLNEIKGELVQKGKIPVIKLFDITGNQSEIEISKENGVWQMDSNMARIVPPKHKKIYNDVIKKVIASGKWKDYAPSENPPDIEIDEKNDQIIIRNDTNPNKPVINKLSAIIGK
jgi:hypothetical protein